MIYDSFYFFDELDLLEIRLNILSNYVDYFVIVESSETFNGQTKELFFQKNIDRYKAWNHKIIHYVVYDFPNDKEILNKALLSKNTGNKEHWWVREFYQKESLIKALKDCNDSDIIYLSDVDEIWNPKINIQIQDDLVYKPIQDCYTFYLNNRSNQNESAWTGTRVSNFKTLKKHGPNHIRTEREVESIKIQNGGWHFSWLHKTYDKWNDGHPDNIIRFNLANNYKMWKDESQLPDYLIANKSKWKDLFLD